MLRLGFVLVRGVPVERGPVPKLQVDIENIFGHNSPFKKITSQARVAFERLTHYGPGYTVEVTLTIAQTIV